MSFSIAKKYSSVGPYNLSLKFLRALTWEQHSRRAVQAAEHGEPISTEKTASGPRSSVTSQYLLILATTSPTSSHLLHLQWVRPPMSLDLHKSKLSNHWRLARRPPKSAAATPPRVLPIPSLSSRFVL
ncbi:hypothetical protein CRG98_008366 [Punica granatum]|uniref:Uncharacterized protein n=1 Tax=Punica granatum TaxID=22663 RepID=A0A2I0KRU6_PUNGR|nr:hypothetical protein CRG98_008366 [Punica granatum]